MTYVSSAIKREVFSKDVLKVLEDKYSHIGPIWTSQQMEWCNGVYQTFKDHDKYLIIIYLIKKTLDFYSRNFIKLTYDEFYSHDTINVGKFNMMEMSKVLNIPKETTRRKFVELEKLGIIKKKEKKIIINGLIFPLIKPIKSTQRMSRFLSVFSKMLTNENILSQEFNSVDIERIIKKNFSHVWKIYYEMQVPMLLGWKKVFKDLDTFHIWGVCGLNLSLDFARLNIENNINEKSRDQFLNEIFTSKDPKIHGTNAMSLSDITGIPRATVVRKLKKLVKLNYLKVDKKKLYKFTGTHSHKIKAMQKITIERLASFSTTVFNLILIES